MPTRMITYNAMAARLHCAQTFMKLSLHCGGGGSTCKGTSLRLSSLCEASRNSQCATCSFHWVEFSWDLAILAPQGPLQRCRICWVHQQFNHVKTKHDSVTYECDMQYAILDSAQPVPALLSFSQSDFCPTGCPHVMNGGDNLPCQPNGAAQTMLLDRHLEYKT